MLKRQRKPPKAYNPDRTVRTTKGVRVTVPPIKKRVSVVLQEAANIIGYAQKLLDLTYLYEDLSVGPQKFTTTEGSERAEREDKLKEMQKYLNTLSAKVF